MTDEQHDLPEVLQTPPGVPDVDSIELREPAIPTGDGGMPDPREDQPGKVLPEEGLDRDQVEREAWFRSARGMIMANWHDPRTAIKYAVAVLDAVIDPEIDHLKLEPQDISPITEKEAGWQ